MMKLKFPIIRFIYTCLSVMFLSSVTVQAQSLFAAFSAKFVSGYMALNLPELDLSYVSGLQHIGSAASIQKQADFFEKMAKELPAYKANALSNSEKVDFELIKYETTLNLQRLALER